MVQYLAFPLNASPAGRSHHSSSPEVDSLATSNIDELAHFLTERARNLDTRLLDICRSMKRQSDETMLGLFDSFINIISQGENLDFTRAKEQIAILVNQIQDDEDE